MSVDEGLVSPDEECPHLLTFRTCGVCRPRPEVPARPKRPTTTPHSADDPIAPLTGTKDVSVSVHDVTRYLGERTSWLIAGNGFPSDLRSGGWIYLRCDERLGARVRAVAMIWREQRDARTGEDPPGNNYFGSGLAFAVDPNTWEPFDQDLGEDAERMRQGYRYHLTDKAGVVHHLMVRDPLPDGDWDLELYRNAPPADPSSGTHTEDDAR